jgi:hypothetical protein
MFEILAEMIDGRGTIAWGTYDLAHTRKQAEEKAVALRAKGKAIRVIDRDAKKPPREDRFHRGRDRDDE